jgi:hypothetical protein
VIATLPATPALRREQIKVQVALIYPLTHVKGYAAPETKAAAERARLLIEQAEALGEPPEDPLLLFSVLFGFWAANHVAFNGDAMRNLAAQFMALACKQGATAPLMPGHRIIVEPFTERRIELVSTFADQAVIAVENAQLLNELRQRTAELTDSLEQQTASSEVLQVISRSPGDVEPVFASMLENAVRICDAKFGNIFRWDGDALHLVAAHSTPPAMVEARRSPFRPDPKILGPGISFSWALSRS